MILTYIGLYLLIILITLSLLNRYDKSTGEEDRGLLAIFWPLVWFALIMSLCYKIVDIIINLILNFSIEVIQMDLLFC